MTGGCPPGRPCLRRERVAGRGLRPVDEAEVTRVLRRLNVDLLSLQPDLAARVGLVDTGEHLHERGLARPVLTAETQDFTGSKVEVHVGQRLHTGERL